MAVSRCTLGVELKNAVSLARPIKNAVAPSADKSVEAGGWLAKAARKCSPNPLAESFGTFQPRKPTVKAREPERRPAEQPPGDPNAPKIIID